MEFQVRSVPPMQPDAAGLVDGAPDWPPDPRPPTLFEAVALREPSVFGATPPDGVMTLRPGGVGTFTELTGSADPALGDVTRFAQQLGGGLLEVISGHRAAATLTRWIADPAARSLLWVQRQFATSEPRTAGASRRRQVRVAIRSLHVQVIGPQTAEVCLHASLDGEQVMVAFRLIGHAGRWHCCELDVLTPNRSHASS